ncbi:hemin uptake protein HemP [Algicella marina]|uniref:Hemin uptake protein HemP n=1 Tax=Algicella marina TaxID=2683284 RepID=A0A6P1T1C8_9RHOB|nr:hemin uptake protein HemP [Algicella marina]QHQ35256.1 hemin uptake protein HemP [Algicella marina]
MNMNVDRNSTAQARPAHRAEDLTEGFGQASITLGDQVYTLRITKAGKLILTK